MATKLDNKKQWYMATVAETCEAFGVQLKHGLTSEQVRERSNQNQKKQKAPPIKSPKINRVFWAAIIVMLVFSASVFVLESNSAVFIFAFSACLLGAFALIQQGFVKHILQTIAKAPQVQVSVKRNSAIEQIAIGAVVEGDILIFKQGDYIPVDTRIAEAKDLFIAQYDGSNQGLPAQKNTFTLHKKTKQLDQKNTIVAGSFIVSGSGLGIATTTAEISVESAELRAHALNTKQQKRNVGVIAGAFVLGLSVMFWGVPVFAAISLSALLAGSTYYYALFWIQFVTWASLYDQAVIGGLRFKDFDALKAFYKVDFVFIDVPSDFEDVAALIHQLQAELRIEVRPLVQKADVAKLEKELNISGSALTYKDFMNANRAKKIKLLGEYQLLVGFDSVAVAEAVSLLRQAEHHVLWIDDSEVPQAVSAIANTYISLADEPTAFMHFKSAVAPSKQLTLKKIATFIDVKEKYKNITAY